MDIADGKTRRYSICVNDKKRYMFFAIKLDTRLFIISVFMTI